MHKKKHSTFILDPLLGKKKDDESSSSRVIKITLEDIRFVLHP